MTGSYWTVTPAQPAPKSDNYWSVTPPEPDQPASPPMKPLAEVGKEAFRNLPSSALEFGKNIIHPFLHPIDTAQGLASIVSAYGQRARNLSPPELRGSAPPFSTAPADALEQYFKDRYGGTENIKGTVAKDPVGALADASVVLTGGAALPARLPGVVGQTARAVGTVGRAVDPVNIAVSGGVKLPAAIGSSVIGTMTGSGGAPIREAFKAGKTGGDYAKAFLDNLRGDVPASDVVESARGAVDQMRADRGNAYRSGMVDVSKDPAILSFDPIDAALQKVQSIGTYKGQVIDEAGAATTAKIAQVIEDWKRLDPAEFHTVEGLDALKKKIGKIRDGTDFGKPERVAADTAYNAVKDQIVQQAPTYGKVMKDYEAASEALREVEKALSLGEKASVDTALRKLQSIMRNNVNTNYGKRAELGQTLVDSGAGTLMPTLAGQALNKWTPRGLQALGAQGTAISSFANPAFLGALPFMSPRVMGEAAYYAGRATGAPAALPGARAVSEALDPYSLRMLAYQSGQMNSPSGPLRRLPSLID